MRTIKLSHRFMVLAAALILLTSAVACNKNTDPHVGRWNAVSGTFLGMTTDIGDLFAGQTSVQLRANGTCTVTIDGSSATGSWSEYGGIFRISAGGENYTGIIDHSLGQLVVSLPAHGFDVNFEHEDGNIAIIDSEPTPEPPPGGWRSEDPEEWWYGDWFGYLSVTDTSGDTDSPFNYKLSCFGISGRICQDENSIYLYGDSMVIGTAVFTLDFSAGGRGRAIAAGGELFGTLIEPGRWDSDPQLSPDGDQFIISWRGELPDDMQVDYRIVLRPWGQLWDDVPVGERPPDYDWYLDKYSNPLLEAGVAVDTAIEVSEEH